MRLFGLRRLTVERLRYETYRAVLACVDAELIAVGRFAASTGDKQTAYRDMVNAGAREIVLDSGRVEQAMSARRGTPVAGSSVNLMEDVRCAAVAITHTWSRIAADRPIAATHAATSVRETRLFDAWVGLREWRNPLVRRPIARVYEQAFELIERLAAGHSLEDDARVAALEDGYSRIPQLYGRQAADSLID